MIDLEKDTPIEYSKQSRDYQVFRFLYTVLFNQVKMYADLIKNIWTDNIDPKLLDLRAYTLNFIPRYQWDNSDLLGTTNNFKYLLRTKGTTGAIKSCLEILARVHGIELTGTNVEVIGPGKIRLILNEKVADTGSIEDLLRYILPAGITYEIIKYSQEDSNVYENIVAQMLTAAGNRLFYHTWPTESGKHNYEIDFILSRGSKINPIEVKSSGYNTHVSLDAFRAKYSSRIGQSYLVYTKDLRKDSDVLLIPTFMSMFI